MGMHETCTHLQLEGLGVDSLWLWGAFVVRGWISRNVEKSCSCVPAQLSLFSRFQPLRAMAEGSSLSEFSVIYLLWFRTVHNLETMA